MIPIKYPDNVPLSAFSGTMHDLNETLKNPKPRDDWKTGDVGWVYVRNAKRVLCGPLTFVRSENVHPHAMILDACPDDGRENEVLANFEEIFPSEQDLLSALFRIDDTHKTNMADKPAEKCIVKSLFANPMDDDPACTTPGDIFDDPAELHRAHPGCRVLFGFCVADPITGTIPDGCSDWHHTSEEAWKEYESVAKSRHVNKNSVPVTTNVRPCGCVEIEIPATSIEVDLKESDVFNWLTQCTDTEMLTRLSNYARSCARAVKAQNEDTDDFRSRA